MSLFYLNYCLLHIYQKFILLWKCLLCKKSPTSNPNFPLWDHETPPWQWEKVSKQSHIFDVFVNCFIVITFCPACVRPSCVVCCASSTVLLVNTLQATFCIQSSWKCIRTFISIQSWTSSKLGHMKSKTRSLGRSNWSEILLILWRPHF